MKNRSCPTPSTFSDSLVTKWSHKYAHLACFVSIFCELDLRNKIALIEIVLNKIIINDTLIIFWPAILMCCSVQVNHCFCQKLFWKDPVQDSGKTEVIVQTSGDEDRRKWRCMIQRNRKERRLRNTIFGGCSLNSLDGNITFDLTLLYLNEICFYIKPAF